MKTAIVIGATGLTGRYIVRFLLESKDYAKVVMLTRRKFPVQHPKLVNHVVNFDKIDEWTHLVQGDDLFSAMGTTIKQAGSKEAFYNVDFAYQANTIYAGAVNGMKRLYLVSAPNANTKSRIYYLKVKGELEAFVMTQGYKNVAIFQPSIIHGKREEKRIAEKIGFKFLQMTSGWMPGLKKYKPISGVQLARAMVNFGESDISAGTYIFELDEIFGLL